MTQQDLLLATGKQSRDTDQRTIESFGIPGQTLMEIAGNRAADIIIADFLKADFPTEAGFPAPSSALFICGKGNNAGDAFVIARILLNNGFKVTLLPVLGDDGYSPDAQLNHDRLMHLSREMDVDVPVLKQFPPSSDFDLIVDGIFGTGLERPVTSPVSDVVDCINRSGKPVYALDIPSGIHSDSGEVLGCAVRAAKTIQFGIRKLGCYLGEGPLYCGSRELVSLPFPVIYKNEIRIRLADITLQPLRKLEFRQDQPGSGIADPDSNTEHPGRGNPSRIRRHKYNNGVVHVIGGSPGLTGAPVYAARAAWSLGMGAVSLVYPSAWALSMESLAPHLIKVPVGGSVSQPDTGYFREDDASAVLKHLQDKEGVTVIGPGIGRHEQTRSFVLKIIQEHDGPMIIDADALHCIRGYEQIISEKQHPEQVILTPHPGEIAALTGEKQKSDQDRLHAVKDLSDRLGCVILAKGSPVILHSQFGLQTIITPYDTADFSRAGFGDTLSGHIAAFLSRTGSPLDSCECALIYGFNKLNEVKATGKKFPEPSDLS